MPARSVLTVVLALGLLHIGLPASAQVGPYTDLDPFMGDWQGALKLAAGGEKPICAQVICWGAEGYQANLLPVFDQRVEPLAVLRGQRDGDGVKFGDQAMIRGKVFSGKLAGDNGGAFEMAPVVRLSPTLGAKPPANATVLFDGTSLDGWVATGGAAFEIDLMSIFKTENCALYMRSRVSSPEAQPAVLQLGSDDGVKAWLNGKAIHTNAASRGLQAFSDSVNIDLAKGENVLMLKILQDGGGAGGCARIVGRDGKDLPGLAFDPKPTVVPATDLPAIQGGSTGTIVTWEVAGPYTQAGKSGLGLVDVAFAPETDPGSVKWAVANDKPIKKEWKLVDGGAMQVTPGAGSIISKHQSGDFRLHLEFRSPFEPDARGQGRGNSGVYFQSRYEIQVLESYGLPGYDNECGGIYKVSQPLVNMCSPPTQWQTYDVEYHAPRKDPATGKYSDALITAYHNGVLIQKDVRQPADNPGGQDVQMGGLLLQDHGNLVQYRNIWVAPLDAPWPAGLKP